MDLVSGELDLSEGSRALFDCQETGKPAGWDTFLRCVAAEDVDRVREALEHAAAGKPIDIHYAINHRERGRCYVRQNAEPLDEDGHLVRVVGTIQDMTAYRQLELQLRQSQKMESVGQLAGGVAHDFNNLLTVISGYAAMLLDGLPPGAETRDSVGEIARAADRAAALTSQLLAFSRRQMILPKVISLNDLLRNLQKMLRRLIGEDIALELTLNPATESILADPGWIEQVVVNLAVNARDAMPEGGKLIIRTANRHFDKPESTDRLGVAVGQYVELTVMDTGSGIAPDVLPRIFEPFFTTKERGKGTGLGLSTVYGIVQQSGGAIQVQSEPGFGTTFEILLPATESAPGPEVETAQPSAGASGIETVLVVEDEAGVRKLIQNILRSRGYHVLEANDGREALRIAQQYEGRIDLLLTDVIMPEMGGVELAERFSELRPGTAILHMSGYADRAIRPEIMERTLQKPFTPSTLLRRIRESLTDTRPGGSERTGRPGV